MRKKNPAAQALGQLGGKARAKSLTKAELSKIGKKGARSRLDKTTAASVPRLPVRLFKLA